MALAASRGDGLSVFVGTERRSGAPTQPLGGLIPGLLAGSCISSPSPPSLPPSLADVGGPADPIAPAIIVPPKNTSVTMGRNEAIMECVANARYPTHTHTHLRAHGSTKTALDSLSKHPGAASDIPLFK